MGDTKRMLKLHQLVENNFRIYKIKNFLLFLFLTFIAFNILNNFIHGSVVKV